MKHQATTTTDHNEIQHWIEARRGVPSVVRATHQREGSGLLRVDFPEKEPDEGLEAVSWDEFFKIFEGKDLAFLYQDQTSHGDPSRVCKFITRS